MIKKILTAALPAAAAIALLMPLGVQAATLKNLDNAAHAIEVVEGDASRQLTIDSQQELTEICESSCSLYVGDDPDPYSVVVDDRMEIKNGEIFHRQDTTEASSN
ncbi:MAG: hypothetical protein ACR2PG_14990 [Hyphomicrobiaceae bacterium]